MRLALRLLAFTVFLPLPIPPLHAQTVTGRVLEHGSERPIEGVRVTAASGRFTVLTGSLGRFTLTDITGATAPALDALEALREHPDIACAAPAYVTSETRDTLVLVNEVAVEGPSAVPEDSFCTWTANAQGGDAPYTYEWYRNGSYVGSGDTYEASTGRSDFTLLVDATDSDGTIRSDQLSVTVTRDADPGGDCGA